MPRKDSTIHLALIFLLFAHRYQKVCLIASKMDVSTPAIRGSQPLGRLMGLVMMLIRYTMIEIPLLTVCASTCTWLAYCTQRYTPPTHTQMRLTQNTIREISFHTNKNLITSIPQTEYISINGHHSSEVSQLQDCQAWVKLMCETCTKKNKSTLSYTTKPSTVLHQGSVYGPQCSTAKLTKQLFWSLLWRSFVKFVRVNMNYSWWDGLGFGGFFFHFFYMFFILYIVKLLPAGSVERKSSSHIWSWPILQRDLIVM